MPRFALEAIEIPRARIKLFKLMVNGHSAYDAWRSAIEQAGTFAEELDSIDTILQRHACMETLSPKKFKELKSGKKDTVKDFEAVTGNLRVYLFKIAEGKAIVLGGYANKTDQPQDIAAMRRLKKDYYDSL